MSTDTGATATTERAHLERLARRLYVLAWVIEGIAVALGLGMALSQNILGENSIINFLLGAGGFVMVACAELSKIPLATFFVRSASRRAKLAALGFLLLMSFITFETIFFSLERGFNVRLLKVRLQMEEIARLKNEHATASKAVENPTADLAAIRRSLDERRKALRESYKEATGSLSDRRGSLHREKKASDLPAEIADQLKSVERRRAAIQEERDKNLAGSQERSRVETRVLQSQVDSARRANDTERYNEARARLAAAYGRADREKRRIESEYEKGKNELATIEQSLRSQRTDLVTKSEEAVRPELEELARLEKELYSEHLLNTAALEKEASELAAREAAIMTGTVLAQRRRDELANQIEVMELGFRILAAESQLHRIAAPLAGWWTNEQYEPHTVPEAYVRRVAAIWFGSMAALGALGGAVIAMISQLLMRCAVVEDPRSPAEVSAPATRVLLFFVLLKRALKSSKPKVKTVTRIVAVPVPTRDPSSVDPFNRTYAKLTGPMPDLEGQTASR